MRRHAQRRNNEEGGVPGINPGIITLYADGCLRCLCVDNLRKRWSVSRLPGNQARSPSVSSVRSGVGGDNDPRHGETSIATYVVVVTVWAVLVALVVVGHVFPERLSALLAHEGHLCGLAKPVVLGLCVAFRAVEPLLAAGRADGNLRVEDMFAAKDV